MFAIYGHLNKQNKLSPSMFNQLSMKIFTSVPNSGQTTCLFKHPFLVKTPSWHFQQRHRHLIWVFIIYNIYPHRLHAPGSVTSLMPRTWMSMKIMNMGQNTLTAAPSGQLWSWCWRDKLFFSDIINTVRKEIYLH